MDDWWDMSVASPLPAGQNAGDGLLDTSLFTPGEIPVPTSNAVEEVIVMGDAPGDSGDGGGWGYWGSGGGGTGDPFNDSGGGGGGSSSSSNGDGNQQHDCQAEERVDTFAKAIARNIMDQPDWDKREYASTIYRKSDGTITFTQLARGEISDGRNPAQANVTIPSDLGSGKILGIIHNHPGDAYDLKQNLENRSPSENDWQTFDTLIRQGRADKDSLALYLVDYKGVLREFNDGDQNNFTAREGVKNPTKRQDVDHNPEC